MDNISFEIISEDNIEQCRELCNELMAFQKSKANLYPEAFDNMSFDTRMKPSYDKALEKQVILVKDKDIPMGYVFSTIDLIDENEKNALPPWATTPENSIGFYPHWLKLPQKVGRISNLYLREQYMGMGLDSKLFGMAMEWLGSFSDCKIAFVYISNGNENAYNFYLNKGFTYSHEVFGGFIKAAYYEFEK